VFVLQGHLCEKGFDSQNDKNDKTTSSLVHYVSVLLLPDQQEDGSANDKPLHGPGDGQVEGGGHCVL